MSKKFAFILFLPILFFNISASKDNALLIKVRKNIAKSEPFRLNFKQEVYDNTELLLKEEGNILVVNVNKIKWVYNKPEYKIFQMKGNEYNFYDEENNQLTKGKIGKNRQKWIWQILFSKSVNDEIICKPENNMIIIKNKEDAINLKIFVGENGLPERVISLQDEGVQYVYTFFNYKPNVKYNDEEFKLKLPEGTEIIERD